VSKPGKTVDLAEQFGHLREWDAATKLELGLYCLRFGG
jgi:hypothetical protein